MMISRRYAKNIFFHALAFFCFLSSLFIIVDYSLKGHLLELSLLDYLIYYGMSLYRKIDLLLPFALLIAVLKTLIHANQRLEFVALSALGISIKRVFLFLPLAGAAIFLFSLYGEERFLPKAIETIREYETNGHEKHHQEKKSLSSFHLQSGEEVVYQLYDPELNAMVDSYLLCSFDEIYRIQLLYLTTPLQGKYVDHFQRNEQGELEWKSSSEWKLFSHLFLKPHDPLAPASPPTDRSLTVLFEEYLHPRLMRERLLLETTLYHKIASPLLSYFALLLPTITAISFRRNRRFLPTIVLNLVALTILILAMNSLTILAKGGIVPPCTALFVSLTASLLVTLLFLRL